jgi:hypothetical protein
MDHILYWNYVALEANRRDFSNGPGTERPSPEQGGPTLSSRALAIVHLAMYDAHSGVISGPALAGNPDLTRNVGGVPLGLKVAEDIFAAGAGIAPVKSDVLPRP